MINGKGIFTPQSPTKTIFLAFMDEKKNKNHSMSNRTVTKQEGHDGPDIAHLSLLTKHAPSSFPVT